MRFSTLTYMLVLALGLHLAVFLYFSKTSFDHAFSDGSKTSLTIEWILPVEPVNLSPDKSTQSTKKEAFSESLPESEKTLPQTSDTVKPLDEGVIATAISKEVLFGNQHSEVPHPIDDSVAKQDEDMQAPIQARSFESETVNHAPTQAITAQEDLLQTSKSDILVPDSDAYPEKERLEKAVQTPNTEPVGRVASTEYTSPKAVSAPAVIRTATPKTANLPKYPRRAIRQSLEGTVEVLFSVGRDGQASDLSLAVSSGYSLLDNAVIDFIQQESFEPATDGLVPIDSLQRYRFRFQLR